MMQHRLEGDTHVFDEESSQPALEIAPASPSCDAAASELAATSSQHELCGGRRKHPPSGLGQAVVKKTGEALLVQ